MRINSIIYFVIGLMLFSACTREWENHYEVYPETVNQNFWEAMSADSRVSEFVKLLKEFRYDTLFQTDDSYTVFAPDNDAVSRFYGEGQNVDTTLLNYHISTHFIQSGSITAKRKVQTLSKKYALFERSGNKTTLDGIELIQESPLFLNGKYFTLSDVAKPLPNLYEYFMVNNPVLRNYIDSQDSIILDREKSKPIGFDDDGKTIYDSVNIIYNKFEAKYFPVSKEDRNYSATVVFPKKDDYESALTEMALDLSIPSYTSFNDIPVKWQEDILLPFLLEQGVFMNMLEPEEFIWKTPKDTLKLQNVLGDSIKILYNPVEKTICSNGYAYNYDAFVIPDSLYTRSSRFEAEWLLDETGINRYAWYDFVKVNSSATFAPLQEFINNASNDSIIRVLFTKGYTGNFSIEFYTRSVFPRRYAMEIATHMDIGGIYDIYVNDELVKTFDYYDFVRYRGVIPSVIPGKRYIARGRFNSFDLVVDNIPDYSRVKVKIDYKGPGTGIPSNGLVLDYIDFIPF